jgi:hypothetical protein
MKYIATTAIKNKAYNPKITPRAGPTAAFPFPDPVDKLSLVKGTKVDVELEVVLWLMEEKPPLPGVDDACDVRPGVTVASELEGEAEAATDWAWEGLHVVPMGIVNAHAGMLIAVMDTLAEMPVASNVVRVQLPAHSVMKGIVSFVCSIWKRFMGGGMNERLGR